MDLFSTLQLLHEAAMSVLVTTTYGRWRGTTTHMHGDIYFSFIAIYIHMDGDVSHYCHAYVYSILISSCIKVYQPMICQGTEIPGI